MRALALVLALLLAGSARAEDAPRDSLGPTSEAVLVVQTATVRTKDGRELAVVGGFWLPRSVALQNADALVRCPAERDAYRKAFEEEAAKKPPGVPVGTVVLVVLGVAAAAYGAGKLAR